VIVAIKKRGYVGWPRIPDCGRSHRAIGVPSTKGSQERTRPWQAKLRVIYEGGHNLQNPSAIWPWVTWSRPSPTYSRCLVTIAGHEGILTRAIRPEVSLWA
jgi:hypothetical protein